MAKVLVIDDSGMMRLYLRRCLEKAGYAVEEWTAPVAMDIPGFLEASAPDLVLSDYQMPGCNGASVARMVHKASPGLPVLILTAKHVTPEELSFLKGNHIHQLIQKGDINKDGLLAAVARMVNPPPPVPPVTRTRTNDGMHGTGRNRGTV